jgi:hypothetical protein
MYGLLPGRSGGSEKVKAGIEELFGFGVSRGVSERGPDLGRNLNVKRFVREHI